MCFIGFGFICWQTVSGGSDPSVPENSGSQPGIGDTILLAGDTVKNTSILQEVDYSIMFSNFLFLNWADEKNANQAGFLQNLKYQLNIDKSPLFKFSGTFTHNLGLQYYFDSITQVQTDNNTLTVNADLFLKKSFHLDFGSVMETQILNGYNYNSRNGAPDRTRISSFLTPLVCTLSLGTGIEWKNFGSLNFGLSSFKLTWLRDRLIAGRYAESIYGMPKGKKQKIEFGLNLHFLADREIFHGVRWNCDLLLFKNYCKQVDMTLKNLFGIRINKFLKTNIQTRILYEKQFSEHIQVENLISFGIYFHR